MSYVSRGALKLQSVASILKLDFQGKLVLDVGSSTGGFTDYALQHGAQKVVAVEAGTKQLHTSLINHPKIELHEKTDIRDFITEQTFDIVLMDLSFVSLRDILPYISSFITPDTDIVAMVKPQFEASSGSQKNKGVVKNERMRRDILKEFEAWVKNSFVILGKADSDITGDKGNRERFYLLRSIQG
jgi:23S rRNA (cytidine1920-2'-O)/16S rRNA (cytidine1409-2'-O)-methyltransferase